MTSDVETLLVTSRFRVERKTHPLSDGGSVTREVIRHPGAVVILPMVDEQRICMLRNYRLAVDETLLELPAGTREVGEDPLVTARRELTEETGYRAGHLEFVYEFYLSPGILDERMRLYIARDLTPGPPAREPGEEMENVIVTWQEVERLIREQRIRDAKSLVSLLMFSPLASPHAGSKTP